MAVEQPVLVVREEPSQERVARIMPTRECAATILLRIARITVRANWRVIFRFDNGAHDVDYLDYH